MKLILISKLRRDRTCCFFTRLTYSSNLARIDVVCAKLSSWRRFAMSTTGYAYAL
ncbi:MAG: hypothetical protein ACYTXA_14685 [Nostoc sp.]